MDPSEMSPAESDAQVELTVFLRENPEWTACADLIVMPPDITEIQEAYPEVKERDLKWDYLSGFASYAKVGITVGAMYMQARAEGGPHNMALMIANQRAFQPKTDDTFFSGQKMLADELGSKKNLQRHLDAAKRNGFTIPQNAIYYPNLARFQFDPQAYITRAHGRSHIRKLLEKRGWSCDGDIKVDGREPEVDPLEKAPKMSPYLVRDYMQKAIRSDPEAARMDRRELREKIIAKHGPQKAS